MLVVGYGLFQGGSLGWWTLLICCRCGGRPNWVRELFSCSPFFAYAQSCASGWPWSHPVLLGNSPFEWRGVLMIAVRHAIYRAYTMTDPAWLPSFVCLGIRLLPGRFDGGRLCFYMGSLAISLFTGNGRSKCLHALVHFWGIVPFTRPFTILSILIVETLMPCVLFVRVSVLPPTPSTLYLESYRSLYGTYTVSVGFRSMVRFMMGRFLALRSSATEISKDKEWFHLRAASCSPPSGAWRRHIVTIKK